MGEEEGPEEGDANDDASSSSAGSGSSDDDAASRGGGGEGEGEEGEEGKGRRGPLAPGMAEEILQAVAGRAGGGAWCVVGLAGAAGRLG